MKRYKIQTHSFPDHLADDLTLLHRKPYPLVVDERGSTVPGQTLPIREVVGFVGDLARQEIDIWFAAATVGLDRIPGTYAVVIDSHGQWSTLSTAVETFELLEEEGK